MRELFWQELSPGDLTARDKLQFELKSDITIRSYTQNTVFKQEYFLFIPQSLQINKETYSRDQFYQDETNLIRFKTPTFTFQEILHSTRSPLNRIPQLCEFPELYKSQAHLVIDEVRLFGNIFRSTLRNRIQELFYEIDRHEESSFSLLHQLMQLYNELKEVRSLYWKVQTEFCKTGANDQIVMNFRYVDEFISQTIQDYLTVLLKNVRDLQLHEFKEIDLKYCELILQELEHYKSFEQVKEETRLHRQSILNKFVLESLILKSNRIAVQEKHSHVFGAIAAGIAMSIYMLLFAWKSPDLVFNSMPFLLLAIVLYVLKDRVKEGLKIYYSRKAFRWFPDYKTQIFDFDNRIIGHLTESFGFINRKDVSTDFLNMRNQDWSEEVEEIDYQESVIQYKREVTLYPNPHFEKARRSELNTFFRLNIHRFLEKASDPLALRFELNPNSLEITSKLLPKIYYIYVILYQYYEGQMEKQQPEIKKFRLVVNKKGINRVEQI